MLQDVIAIPASPRPETAASPRTGEEVSNGDNPRPFSDWLEETCSKPDTPPKPNDSATPSKTPPEESADSLPAAEAPSEEAAERTAGVIAWLHLSEEPEVPAVSAEEGKAGVETPPPPGPAVPALPAPPVPTTGHASPLPPATIPIPPAAQEQAAGEPTPPAALASTPAVPPPAEAPLPLPSASTPPAPMAAEMSSTPPEPASTGAVAEPIAPSLPAQASVIPAPEAPAPAEPPAAPETPPLPAPSVAEAFSVPLSPEESALSAANDPASALPLAETGALPAVPAPPPPASSPTPPPSAETSLASAPGAEAGPAPVESAESSDGFRGDDFSPSGRQPVPTALELSGSEPVMNVPGEASAAPVATAAPVVPPGGPVPSTMPPAALLENLDRIVLHSVRGDPHSIRIELEPASLGRVMVHCRETSDGMSVEINVQNNGIRSLLTAQEQDLRLSLESQGYQMGRFSVSCRDGDGRPDADHAGRQPHPDLSEPEERRTRSGAPSVEAAATTNGAKSASRNRWVA